MPARRLPKVRDPPKPMNELQHQFLDLQRTLQSGDYVSGADSEFTKLVHAKLYGGDRADVSKALHRWCRVLVGLGESKVDSTTLAEMFSVASKKRVRRPQVAEGAEVMATEKKQGKRFQWEGFGVTELVRYMAKAHGLSKAEILEVCKLRGIPTTPASVGVQRYFGISGKFPIPELSEGQDRALMAGAGAKKAVPVKKDLAGITAKAAAPKSRALKTPKKLVAKPKPVAVKR